MLHGLIRAIYLSQGKAVEIEFQGWAGVFIPLRRFKQVEQPPEPTVLPARPGSIRAQAIAAAYLVLSPHPPGTILTPKQILPSFDLLPDHQPFLPDKANRLYRFGHELWIEAARRDGRVCHHPGRGYSLPEPVVDGRQRLAAKAIVPLAASAMAMVGWWLKSAELHAMANPAHYFISG